MPIEFRQPAAMTVRKNADQHLVIGFIDCMKCISLLAMSNCLSLETWLRRGSCVARVYETNFDAFLYRNPSSAIKLIIMVVNEMIEGIK